MVVSLCCGWVQSSNDVTQKIKKTLNETHKKKNNVHPTMVSVKPIKTDHRVSTTLGKTVYSVSAQKRGFFARRCVDL